MISSERFWKEVKGIIQALVLVLLIRTFLYQAFTIPTGSMIPTLLVGDFLFVNKFCYGYGDHSLPLAPPVITNRVGFKGRPERGDIVVFFNRKSDQLDYIKRCIGLPGDTVQMINGILYINEKPAPVVRDGEHHVVDEDGRLIVLEKYIETLPNGVKHPILKQFSFGQAPLDNTPKYIVPKGCYFMMGDNRDRSADSRVMEKVGFVEERDLMGRADVIFFSSGAKWYDIPNFVMETRLERLGSRIR